MRAGVLEEVLSAHPGVYLLAPPDVIRIRVAEPDHDVAVVEAEGLDDGPYDLQHPRRIVAAAREDIDDRGMRACRLHGGASPPSA